jgi:hypothetical protein
VIYIVGSQLKELRKEAKFKTYDGYPWSNNNIAGVYMGEEVFLCPYLIIDRDRGICNKCKHRFKCFTNRWGYKKL